MSNTAKPLPSTYLQYLVLQSSSCRGQTGPVHPARSLQIREKASALVVSDRAVVFLSLRALLCAHGLLDRQQLVLRFLAQQATRLARDLLYWYHSLGCDLDWLGAADRRARCHHGLHTQPQSEEGTDKRCRPSASYRGHAHGRHELDVALDVGKPLALVGCLGIVHACCRDRLLRWLLFTLVLLHLDNHQQPISEQEAS